MWDGLCECFCGLGGWTLVRCDLGSKWKLLGGLLVQVQLQRSAQLCSDTIKLITRLQSLLQLLIPGMVFASAAAGCATGAWANCDVAS